MVRDPKGGKKEEYRVVSIKKTGILKKVRKGIEASKVAAVVIVVVGVVVVVVMEDRDPLTTPIKGRTGQSGWRRRSPESSQ